MAAAPGPLVGAAIASEDDDWNSESCDECRRCEPSRWEISLQKLQDNYRTKKHRVPTPAAEAFELSTDLVNQGTASAVLTVAPRCELLLTVDTLEKGCNEVENAQDEFAALIEKQTEAVPPHLDALAVGRQDRQDEIDA